MSLDFRRPSSDPFLDYSVGLRVTFNIVTFLHNCQEIFTASKVMFYVVNTAKITQQYFYFFITV